MNPPKVFVSYSWDSPEHRQWVAALAERLRSEGVDAILDRWALAPGDQLPKFMETSIRESDFVVMICTPKYREKSNGRFGGVGYEGAVITGEVVTGTDHRKFIPILRHTSWKEAAPSWMTGTYYVDLTNFPASDDGFHELLDTIHGIRESAPPIGQPPARRTAQAPNSSTASDRAGDAAEHSELVKQLGIQISAFPAAQDWLRDPKLMRICKNAPSKLIKNWLTAMDKHPRDERAVASLMTRIWKEALDLRLVPPLPALDKRIDLEKLAQTHAEKKAFWGVLETEQSRLIGLRALGRKAVFGWKEGAWESQHQLAGPLFEWIWDVLRYNHEQKIARKASPVQWWGAGAGILRFDGDVVFPWPVADMVYFFDYDHVARMWNTEYARAVQLLQSLPEEPSIVDDLAFCFVEAQHKRWHRKDRYGGRDELSYVSDRRWKGAVAHFFDSAMREEPSEFTEWVRAVPLFAAPESGLSDEAAAAILDGANLDETGRLRLRELRLQRARHSAPGQDAETIIAKIDKIFAAHPWVVQFGRA